MRAARAPLWASQGIDDVHAGAFPVLEECLLVSSSKSPLWKQCRGFQVVQQQPAGVGDIMAAQAQEWWFRFGLA